MVVCKEIVDKQGWSEKLFTFEQKIGACLWSEGQYAGSLSPANGLLLIATDQAENLLGYLLGQWIVDEIEILQLTVAPEIRRQGVGRALMEYLLLTGKEREGNKILLEVAADNDSAVTLYGKMGFSIDGRRKNYYLLQNGVRVDAVLMSLSL